MPKNLKIRIDGDSKDLQADVRKSKKALEDLGRKGKAAARQTSNEFNKLNKSVRGATLSVGSLASAAAAVGFGKLVKDTMAYGDRLHKLSIRLGVASDSIDKLKQVAELSGIGFESVATSIQYLARNSADAAEGVGEAKDAFKRLNIDAAKLLELPLEKQFVIVADALDQMENQNQKVNTAMEIFGRSGGQILQMLPGLNKNLATTTSYFNQETVTRMAETNDQLTMMKNRIMGLAAQMFKATDYATKFWAELIYGEPLTNKQKEVDDIKASIGRLNKELAESKMPTIEGLGIQGRSTAEIQKELDSEKRKLKIYQDDLDRYKAHLHGQSEKKEKPKKPQTDGATKSTDEDKAYIEGQKLAAKAGLDSWRIADGKRIEDYEHTQNTLLALENQRLADEKEANDKAIKLATEKTNNMRMLKEVSVSDEIEIERIKEETLNKMRQDALQKRLDQEKAFKDQWGFYTKDAVDSFAGGMSSAFIEFAEGTKSAEKAFKDFARSFLNQIAQMIIKQQILNAIKSTSWGASLMGAAKGAVFEGGVQKMAKGGIVNKPTLFPMANGAGLMGEAGPEAVMPLGRNSKGELGVKGGGGNTTVVYNIQAIDSQSLAEHIRRNESLYNIPLVNGVNRGDNGVLNALKSGVS